MKLHAIDTGHFKLDGGAMFGVVPKQLWEPLYPSDSQNLCSWAMRCLLVETSDRLILIDTGIGNKQNEKFFAHYHLHGSGNLDSALAAAGFSRDAITDVFLTHLHFDHCGGAIEWNESRSGFRPAFKNAQFWSNQAHWQWATEPNPREKASFLHDNIQPIRESGQLQFLESDQFLPHFDVIRVSGHTESMMLPLLQVGRHKVLYMADLLPSPVHVPLPWVMAYDTRPLLTMDEKARILKQAADEEWVLFFEHDYRVECATLMHTEKGIRVRETFPLSALFS